MAAIPRGLNKLKDNRECRARRAKRAYFRHSVFVRPCGLPSQIFSDTGGVDVNLVSKNLIGDETRGESTPASPLWGGDPQQDQELRAHGALLQFN